jgi:hypothetical protein
MGEDGHAMANGSSATSTSSSEKEAQAEQAKTAANKDFKGKCSSAHMSMHASSLAAVEGQLLLQLPQL